MNIKRLTVISFLLLVFSLYVSFIPFRHTVAFYDAKTNERLAFMPLVENQTFSIQYTHSIHLSLVKETYETTEHDEIRQIELMYEDFAIGMPSQAEEHESFVQENGKYYIKNMNRVFPEIVLRVGKVAANHQLVVGDKVIAMSSFTSPGSVIKIKPTKLNIWDQWKGVNIFDGF